MTNNEITPEAAEGWLPGAKPKKKRGDAGQSGHSQQETQQLASETSRSSEVSSRSSRKNSRGGSESGKGGARAEDDALSVQSFGSGGAEEVQSRGSIKDSSAWESRKGRGRPDDRCHKCGERGHLKSNCPKNANGERCRKCGTLGHGSGNCPAGSERCRTCGQPGHYAASCPNSSVKCFRCGDYDHLAGECPIAGPKGLVCHNCRKPGHMSKECPEPLNINNVACRSCGVSGHFARDCPRLQREACYICGSVKHFAQECPQPTSRCRRCGGEHPTSQCTKGPLKKCRRCGETGHAPPGCPYPGKRNWDLCWRCKVPGHTVGGCVVQTDHCESCGGEGHVPKSCPFGGDTTEAREGGGGGNAHEKGVVSQERPSSAFVRAKTGGSFAAAVNAGVWETFDEGQFGGVRNEWGQGGKSVPAERGEGNVEVPAWEPRERDLTGAGDSGESDRMEESQVVSIAASEAAAALGFNNLDEDPHQDYSDLRKWRPNGNDSSGVPQAEISQVPGQLFVGMQEQAVGSRPLNPNTQEFMPPTKAVATIEHLEKIEFPSERREILATLESHRERLRSTLSADSPAWQPPATLAMAVTQGLALGGRRANRDPSIPSQDVRKEGLNWDMQLPDGFVEGKISPVGVSVSAFTTEGSVERYSGAALGKQDVLGEVSHLVGGDSIRLPEDLDGGTIKNDRDLDALLDDFEFRTDSEGEGDSGRQRVRKEGLRSASLLTTNASGAWGAATGESSEALVRQPLYEGSSKIEEATGWGQPPGIVNHAQQFEAGSGDKRGDMFRAEGGTTGVFAPTGWVEPEKVEPTGWREDKQSDVRADSDTMDAPLASSGRATDLGGGILPLPARFVQGVRPEQRPVEVGGRVPAGRTPGTVPHMGASKETAYIGKPSDKSRPNGLGASFPPGFARASDESSPLRWESNAHSLHVNGLEAEPRQPTFSGVDVIPARDVSSYASPPEGFISKAGVPYRVVLSRVLVKRTVVEEGPTLSASPESLGDTDAEVHVAKRPQFHGRRVQELGSDPDGFLEVVPNILGNVVDNPGASSTLSASVHASGLRHSIPVPSLPDSLLGADFPTAESLGFGASALEHAREGLERDSRAPGGPSANDQQWPSSGRGRVLPAECQQSRAVASPPHPPRVLHPHEVLRHFLPQSTDQATSSQHCPPSSAPRSPITSSLSFNHPLNGFYFRQPVGGWHGASSHRAPHWTPPEVNGAPPVSPPLDGGLRRPSVDRTFDPWLRSNQLPDQRQDPVLLEPTGWGDPKQTNKDRASEHVPEQRPHPDHHLSGPLRDLVFSPYPPWQPQSRPDPQQPPPTSSLQNDPHIRKLRATVQEHCQRIGGRRSPGELPPFSSGPTELSSYGGAHRPLTATGSGGDGRDTGGLRTGWNDTLGNPVLSRHDIQTLQGFGEIDLRSNSSGGFDHLFTETPAKPSPELVGPVGSRLPREKPSTQHPQSHYAAVNPQSPEYYNQFIEPHPPSHLYKDARMQSPARGADDRVTAPPDRWSVSRGLPAAKVPERKSAYNPMQWQMAQHEKAKPSEDSLSDVDLERLLSENGLLGSSETRGAEQNGAAGWGVPSGGSLHWPDGDTRDGAGMSNGKGGGRDFETTPLANGSVQRGVNRRPRTVSEIVAARNQGPDDEQFEADLQAAMNLSLEEYKSQETSDYMVAQQSSWPSLRNAPPLGKELVGKGLANRTGEYNCFLNVVIQSLWHLVPFRHSIAVQAAPKSRLSNGQASSRNLAVLRGLNGIFRALSADDGKPTAVDPSALRTALHDAHAGSDLFQIEEMNDASEVLLSIFSCLHEALQGHAPLPPSRQGDGLLAIPSHGAPQRNNAGTLFQATDVCTSNCFVHDLFGLDMMEYTQCQHCFRRTHKLHYQQFFHLVNSAVLSDVMVQSPGLLFAPLLAQVLNNSNPLRPCDKDEGGCGELIPTTHVLDKAPPLFTVVLGWGTAEASQSQVRSVVNAINTQVCLSDIFPNLANQGQHILRCVVCYYGLHYFAFAFSDKARQWLLLDDTNVKVVGSWEKVVEQCTSGRLQPLVLFYQSQRQADLGSYS